MLFHICDTRGASPLEHQHSTSTKTIITIITVCVCVCVKAGACLSCMLRSSFVVLL